MGQLRMSIIKTGLIYFQQAIKDGSIRRAAENLRIASSAVNRQLLQLEEELGAELFERLPRGIRPTAAGKALLGYVHQWNRDAAQLRQEISGLNGGVRGTIHIAAAESITTDILPRAMAALQTRYPLIDFTLISGDNYFVKSALLSKDADIVCAFDVAASSRTETLVSVSVPIGVITVPGHPLTGRGPLSLEDCLEYPIIAPNEGWLRHSVLSDLITDRAIPFRIAARVERIGMLKNLVASNLGIAFLAPVGLEHEVLDGKLAWSPLASGVTRPTTVSLLGPKGRMLAPYTRVFMDMVRTELVNLRDGHAGSVDHE